MSWCSNILNSSISLLIVLSLEKSIVSQLYWLMEGHQGCDYEIQPDGRAPKSSDIIVYSGCFRWNCFCQWFYLFLCLLAFSPRYKRCRDLKEKVLQTIYTAPLQKKCSSKCFITWLHHQTLSRIKGVIKLTIVRSVKKKLRQSHHSLIIELPSVFYWCFKQLIYPTMLCSISSFHRCDVTHADQSRLVFIPWLL